MNKCIFRRCFQAVCLLATGLCGNQGLAGWYGDQAQPNYNRGFGDFPPATIDRQPQREQKIYNWPVDRTPRTYRDSNPWDNSYQPMDRGHQNKRDSSPWSRTYQPANRAPRYYDDSNSRSNSNKPAPRAAPGKSAPNYGDYNQGNSGRPSGDYGKSNAWSNRGPEFEGPWNDKGSSFSPWDKPRASGSKRNPFGSSSPGDWLDPNKRSMSRNWDDMLNAPARSGDMPGGWRAPSVTAPNPVDIGEEFDDAARELPGQMDNFRWNDNQRRY